MSVRFNQDEIDINLDQSNDVIIELKNLLISVKIEPDDIESTKVAISECHKNIDEIVGDRISNPLVSLTVDFLKKSFQEQIIRFADEAKGKKESLIVKLTLK